MQNRAREGSPGSVVQQGKGGVAPSPTLVRLRNFGNAVRLAWDSLRSNKLRSGLTALGMAIGTGSTILVVTIALTSRDYVLGQVQQIGSNLIYINRAGSGTLAGSRARSDALTLQDLEAIRQRVPNLTATAAVAVSRAMVRLPGRSREVTVLGASPEFKAIRNLKILAGRFFDSQDAAERRKVCLITVELARQMFPAGWSEGAVLKVFGVPLDVLGVFEEGAETFGQSEITRETVLLPLSVLTLFTGPDIPLKIYASTQRPSQVPEATQAMLRVVRERHRSSAIYNAGNLTQILAAVENIAGALTLVLVLVSAISLLVSGIGIMNIMLVTVTERTPEIGLRMAVGAGRRLVRLQFLVEALLLSLAGGAVGVAGGAGIPLLARHFLTGLEIPVSWVAIGLALLVSSLCGVVFGIAPAERAAKLNLIEALHYE